MAETKKLYTLADILGEPITEQEAQNLIRKETNSDEQTFQNYVNLNETYRNKLLHFIMGKNGLSITYDTVFRHVMLPGGDTKRLEHFLSIIFDQPIHIKQILPCEGSQIVENGSFVIADIIASMEAVYQYVEMGHHCESTFFRYWIFTYIKKQEELEMKSYEEMTKEELLKEKEGLEAEYKKFQQRGLKLDMSRGKPSQEQLDLSMGMMDVLTSGVDLTCDDGTDCRNYGVLDGISEAKQLIGDMIECNPDNIIIYGNSSLNIMYDTISRSMTHGVMGNTPWCKLDKVKFLCPVPGYDRHFAITEYFGIEMINVPMLPTGPDMDMVEQLVNTDPAVKGILCVPKYSNPQGITYSDETVRRFARLKPAAEDFRIYWDNAYGIHHLYDHDQDHLIEILKECKRAGNPDMVYKFCSTSKITFPGSGVAAIATSANNLEDIKKQLKIQTIGHDKVNQLRHVRFFKDIHGITEHMRKHADSLRPKFEMILDTFERELQGLGAGSWYSPKGGYFITYETLDGCAKNVVAKAKKAGVVMTPAGAPFPYGKDPHDSVIRISPSYPSLEDLTTAIDIFVVCVKLASIEKLLGE